MELLELLVLDDAEDVLELLCVDSDDRLDVDELDRLLEELRLDAVLVLELDWLLADDRLLSVDGELDEESVEAELTDDRLLALLMLDVLELDRLDDDVSTTD